MTDKPLDLDAVRRKLHSRSRINDKLEAAYALLAEVERLRAAHDGEVCVDTMEHAERLEAQLEAGRNIRRYVSFVLTGDEESDVQLAADKLTAQLAEIRAVVDAEVRDCPDRNAHKIQPADMAARCSHGCNGTGKITPDVVAAVAELVRAQVTPEIQSVVADLTRDRERLDWLEQHAVRLRRSLKGAPWRVIRVNRQFIDEDGFAGDRGRTAREAIDAARREENADGA